MENTSPGSNELSFESILNPGRLEATTPEQDRLADVSLSRLNAAGHFQERRLIISKQGELCVCASQKGIAKEG